MAKYANIAPSVADRILTMAEEQAHHRQNLEAQNISGIISQKRLGAYLAFIISVLAIICGTLCIIQGKSAAGIVVIIGELSIFAGIFIYGHYFKK